LLQTNHAAAAASTSTSTTDDGREQEQQNQNQDTLRATLRDLPGPLASSLADELLLCGALSASVDEFRPPGAAEQALFGARGRDKANDNDDDDNDDNGDENSFSPSSDASALFWDRSTLTVIFDPTADVASILNEASINAGVEASSLPEPELSEAKASEWLDALRGAFSPVFIDNDSSGGKSLWILPEGSSLPEEEEEERKEGRRKEEATVVVRLTPGLAFGSGDHPTTKLCLRWLASSFSSSSSPPLQSLLDYGTGSGVLAAAAIALGCRSAVGTDVDPLALVAAAENVALNRSPSDASRPIFRTVLVPSDPGSPDKGEEEKKGLDLVGSPGSFDAVVANILRGPLLALAGTLAAFARPGAPFAVSGILSSQAGQVAGAFEEFGVELTEFGRERAAGGEDWWVCLSGRKRP